MARTKEIATALGTLGCAAAIGFVMQSSESAEKRYGSFQAEAGELKQDKPVAVRTSNAFLTVEQIKLTSAEFDTDVNVPRTDVQVTKAYAPQTLAEPDLPDAGIALACDVSASARPVAAAMVNLTLDASCLPDERLTIHHNGMIFSDTTDASGSLERTVPALSSQATFIIAFSSGEGAVAQTVVDELGDFDRVVLQWRGDTGFEIHAREFGADYGDRGHVWQGAPGEMADAVIGQGGFITRHGDVTAPDALLAEVYSFPASASETVGDIALSVEAEVSAKNCGLEIEAQSLQVQDSGTVHVRNLTLSVPECDGAGHFLVLNNLLQDLKVAAR